MFWFVLKSSLALWAVPSPRFRRHPFLVRLLYDDRFFCAGTLVAPQFVVTAAHCVKDKKVEYLTVVAGITYSYQAGVRSLVNTIVFPKNFILFYIDVKVLKLSLGVYGARIQPIRVCNTSFSPGADVQIYGWGKTNETAVFDVSNQLRMATVQVIEKNICLYMYRHLIFPRKMFCAATLGRTDSCVGDSGGPAIINKQFCGVMSWGEGCTHNKYPGVYTNVKKVRDFITAALRT